MNRFTDITYALTVLACVAIVSGVGFYTAIKWLTHWVW